MHFTVLYFKEGKKLEDFGKGYIGELEEDFGSKFCYSVLDDNELIYDEETDDYIENPDFELPEGYVCSICDWFQVGGRWVDCLKASRGLKGDPSWGITTLPTGYSVVEIKDLDDEFLKTIDDLFYGVATETGYFENCEDEFKEFMTKLKNKELNGVISLIDCHD
jgi:hypothetical protein